MQDGDLKSLLDNQHMQHIWKSPGFREMVADVFHNIFNDLGDPVAEIKGWKETYEHDPYESMGALTVITKSEKQYKITVLAVLTRTLYNDYQQNGMVHLPFPPETEVELSDFKSKLSRSTMFVWISPINGDAIQTPIEGLVETLEGYFDEQGIENVNELMQLILN